MYKSVPAHMVLIINPSPHPVLYSLVITKKLELYRAHTLCAASASCTEMRVGVVHVNLLTTFAFSILGAWAECIWPSRRGYGGQQKGTIVTLVDRIHRFEAYWSQFFAKFGRFVVVTSRSDAYRSPDLAIFVFTTDKKYTNKICRDNVSHPLYIPMLAFLDN